MKVGGGGGEGRIPSSLPHPLPALLLTPFFAQSLSIVPCSLLLNHTETLATQAKDREDENHTLSTGTSLYRPYKGVPPSLWELK